jgi:hypothetical protein
MMSDFEVEVHDDSGRGAVEFTLRGFKGPAGSEYTANTAATARPRAVVTRGSWTQLSSLLRLSFPHCASHCTCSCV